MLLTSQRCLYAWARAWRSSHQAQPKLVIHAYITDYDPDGAGVVQRFSIGFRGPLCIASGLSGVPFARFAGGAMLGACGTIPLQLGAVRALPQSAPQVARVTAHEQLFMKDGSHARCPGDCSAGEPAPGRWAGSEEWALCLHDKFRLVTSTHSRRGGWQQSAYMLGKPQLPSICSQVLRGTVPLHTAGLAHAQGARPAGAHLA